jgi:hypothetical protein
VPLAYTFAAGCNTPHYTDTGGMTPECQMDTIDDMSTITRQITLPKTAPRFHMVAVEGCGSNPPCDASTAQSERFYINHPAQSGVWKTGILVR